MHTTTSAFLDIARLIAAIVVLLGHASGVNWTGGFLWQIGLYMDTAVMVFFVLSGYVIAYVANTRETQWQRFTASRVARIWSVAIPALILTWLVDAWGIHVAPDLYIGKPWFHGDNLILRYLASFFMVHEYWHIGMVPGINGPFWSLSYEVSYYLWFGIAFFAQRKWKWPVLTLLALAAGPAILVLFPIWMLGYIVYRWEHWRLLPASLAWFVLIAGIAGVLLSPQIKALIPAGPRILGEEFILRYISAFSFAASLLGLTSLAPKWPVLPNRLLRVISWAAAPTFALYLFHRPLMQFFSYIGPDDPSSWERRGLVIAGTLLITYLTSPLCDRIKSFANERIAAALLCKN